MTTPVHDPFRGVSPRGRVRTEAAYPEARLAQLDLTDAQLESLRAAWDDADTDTRNTVASFAAQSDDEQLRALALGAYRQSYDTSGLTVDAVRDEVTADPALAQFALDSETGRGDKARKTLVTHLQGVLDAQADEAAAQAQEGAPEPAEGPAVTPAPDAPDTGVTPGESTGEPAAPVVPGATDPTPVPAQADTPDAGDDPAGPLTP